MKVLITGGTGFIGSHLVEACLARGDRVTCLVRESSNVSWLQQQDVEIVRADFMDVASLIRAVNGTDVVFHLAGAIYAPDWAGYYQANCTVTANLVNASIAAQPQIGRFVFVSSISVTGPGKKGEVLTEESPCQPVSDYGRSKQMAEEIVLAASDKLPVVVVRPTNTIGPRQSELLSSIQLIRRRILPTIGNGETQTSICYVSDLVAALLSAAADRAAVGRTYIVAGAGAYAWGELVDAIRTALGVTGFCIRVPFAAQYVVALISELASSVSGKLPMVTRENLSASRDLYWIYDESRIRKELGHMPQVGLQEGIERTVAWYRQQQQGA